MRKGREGRKEKRGGEGGRGGRGRREGNTVPSHIGCLMDLPPPHRKNPGYGPVWNNAQSRNVEESFEKKSWGSG